MKSTLIIATLAIGVLFVGCNKDVIEKQSGEIKSLTVKIDSLNSIVSAQMAELKTLKETDQGFFSQGVSLLKDNKLQEAQTAFSEVINRFPNSQFVSQAQARLRDINSQLALSQISGIESSLSSSDKSTYESAAQNLATILSQQIDNQSRGKATTLLSSVKSMLNSWPVSFDDLKQMQLRFTDLMGKNIVIADAQIEGSDYFNYNFDDKFSWQSFQIKKGGESIHAYAPKGSKLAKELLDKAGSGATAKSIVVKYPYGSEDGSVALLVSCELQ